MSKIWKVIQGGTETEIEVTEVKGFPFYKEVEIKSFWRSFFGLPLKTKKVRDGWESTGEIKWACKDGISTITAHAFCHTPVHIGKQGDVLFYFCPMCMCKVSHE